MSKPYKLEVPGIRVSQGGKEMLLISLLWSQLERFITTVSHETTLERAQRDLNLKRAKNFTCGRAEKSRTCFRAEHQFGENAD